MEKKASQRSNRLLDYGATLIEICIKLNKTAIGRHVGVQLLRAGTSVGVYFEGRRN